MIEQQQLVHPLLGKVTLARRLFTSNMVFDIKVKNLTEVNQWQQRLKLVASCKTSAILLPQGVEKIQRKNETIVKIKFGPYIYLLEHQKANRILLQIPFTEEELWFMLFSLVQASKSIESRSIQVSRINPSTILMDDYGNLKIFWDQSIPNYSQLNKDSSYIRSPQEMLANNNRTILQSIRRPKAESFQIAISMIEIALLVSCEPIFKYKPHIDQTYLSELLGKIRLQYSWFLYSILEAMTEQDAYQRASASQIWAILSPYSQAITNIQKFKPQRASSHTALTGHLSTLKQSKLFPY